MEDLHLYLEILKAELMDSFSKTDPAVGSKAILRKQDFIRLAKTVTQSLEQNPRFWEFAGIPFVNADDIDKKAAESRESELTAAAPISDSTLELVLKSKYKVKQPIEKRALNTLNKLTFFLGYKGWEDFVEQRKLSLNPEDKSVTDLLIEAVTAADAEEFSAYKALPEIDLSNLKKYFIAGSPAYKRIVNVLVRHKFRRWVINDPTNPSAYETYSTVVKQVTNDTAIVVAEEWWYLRWFSLRNFKTPRIYDKRNIQTFTLKKSEEGIWKVYSTHYSAEGAYIRKRK